MSDEEEDNCPDCPNCMPGWVMTFADLMSLLMCFFVLLLSFAEMDIQKFKSLSGSMDKAFGVQREIKAYEIPKGTSIIAREFTPGSPRTTVTNEIRQESTDETKDDLDWSEGQDSGEKRSSKEDDEQKSDVKEESLNQQDLVDIAEIIKQNEQAELEEQLEDIAEKLSEEIKEDVLDVEMDDGKIVIRIKEKGSFPSGRAELRPGFRAVMEKLKEVVREAKGDVIVAGHTDNRSIRNRYFRSNWDLSSARATSVVHELLKDKQIKRERLMVQGHADSLPLVDNETKENRALNRRVEIILVRGKDKETITKLEDVGKIPEPEENKAEEDDGEWSDEEDDESEDEGDGDGDEWDGGDTKDVDTAEPEDDDEWGEEGSKPAPTDVDETSEIQPEEKTNPEPEIKADTDSAVEKTIKTNEKKLDWGEWPTFEEE